MKLGIRYETAYHYAAPVGFSTHEIRLFPRGDLCTRIRRLKFETNDRAKIRFGRDVFDNSVALCSFPEPASKLRFRLELDLELTEKNPFDFLLEGDALALPLTYDPTLKKVLAPFQDTSRSSPLHVPGWRGPTTDKRRSTVETLVELNRRIHEHVGYERREEGPARTPEETLRIGKGACRDVALLLAAALRQCGLAARLTSGYLREAEADSRRAEGSLHAWTEVYLPGAGWVGMDATNGIFCNHNFISAAVGIEPGDITPIHGSFYERQPTAARMTAKLELVQL